MMLCTHGLLHSALIQASSNGGPRRTSSSAPPSAQALLHDHGFSFLSETLSSHVNHNECFLGGTGLAPASKPSLCLITSVPKFLPSH